MVRAYFGAKEMRSLEGPLLTATSSPHGMDVEVHHLRPTCSTLELSGQVF